MIEIEDGATPLEYDEIKGLIPTHITTKGELDALELENIARASAWIEFDAFKKINIIFQGNLETVLTQIKKNIYPDDQRYA